MKLNSVWTRITDKRNRREDLRVILTHAEQLTEEINLRLLLEQELWGEILFVEEFDVKGIHAAVKKKRRLPERIREWIKRFFGRNSK